MPNIAVFIEQRDGALKKVAWQMISEARRIADATDGEVWGVFLGTDASGAATEAGKYGADKVFSASGEEFNQYNSEIYGTALAAFCKSAGPDILLIGSTAMGKDLGPKVAAKLECACISDAVGLKFDGAWEVRRPIFAGKCFADVTPKSAMAVVGIRPNASSSRKRQPPGPVRPSTRALPGSIPKPWSKASRPVVAGRSN